MVSKIFDNKITKVIKLNRLLNISKILKLSKLFNNYIITINNFL